MSKPASQPAPRSPEEIKQMRDMAAYLADLAIAIPEQASMLWRMSKRIEEQLSNEGEVSAADSKR